MKHAIRCLLILACASPASLAQTTTAPTTAPTPAQIPALIKQLSDDNYQTRQDAQDQLVRFGADARPALQDLIAHTTDPEARTRAETAIALIEENRTTGASLITLHVAGAAPDSVLAELSRQAMTPIPTQPENLFRQGNVLSKVTLDVDRQPFWVAFRQFCQQTGVRANSMGNDRKFVLMQGGDDSILGPAVYTGPFMVVANSVTRTSSISFARDKLPSRNLNVQFTVFAEPKLNVMGHDYYVRLSEATDDRGNSLLMPNPGAYGTMGQDTSPRWSLGSQLAIPDNIGAKLARIQGTTRVQIQTKSEIWEIPDISKAQSPSKSIAGRRYVVEEFKTLSPEQYQLKFTIIRETPRLAEWQQYGRGVRLSLVDANGKYLQSQGYGGGGSDEKLTYTHTFGRDAGDGTKTGEPAKLIVEVPTDVKEVQIPFDFKDLPLP